MAFYLTFYYIYYIKIINIIGGKILKNTNDSILLTGTSGSLAISKRDKLSLKIAMLVDNMCFGLKAEQAATKYGFSRSHFFDIKAKFNKGGSDSLIGKKQGPKTNYVRTDNVVNQIIRLRFLDPEISVDVITQKLNKRN